MVPATFCVTVERHLYRAIPDDPPDGPPNDPVSPAFAARTDRNRWNVAGQPTLYRARDMRALAAEWARYAAEEPLDPVVAPRTLPRRIYAIQVAIDRVRDLRDHDLGQVLGLPDPPNGYMRDRRLCQQIAGRLRTETEARALIVPSMGLLDQPEHWVIAFFVEKLPTYPEPFLSRVERRGLLPDLT